MCVLLLNFYNHLQLHSCCFCYDIVWGFLMLCSFGKIETMCEILSIKGLIDPWVKKGCYHKTIDNLVKTIINLKKVLDKKNEKSTQEISFVLKNHLSLQTRINSWKPQIIWLVVVFPISSQFPKRKTYVKIFSCDASGK